MSTLAAAAGGGPDTVTLITESVLALAAIGSMLTPIVLRLRKSHKDALAAAGASAVNSSDLTLAGWTALNTALQQEIGRLQGVQERQQQRIDQLEAELAALTKLALQKAAPDA